MLRTIGGLIAGILALFVVVTLISIIGSAMYPLPEGLDPFDPAQISLWDGKKPPAWVTGADPAYLLGTDNQGRDMLSTILYGGRISLAVGFASVLLGMVLGVGLGVVAFIVLFHDRVETSPRESDA